MLVLTDRSGPLPIHYYNVPGLLLVGVHSASGFTGIYLLPDCQKKEKTIVATVHHSELYCSTMYLLIYGNDRLVILPAILYILVALSTQHCQHVFRGKLISSKYNSLHIHNSPLTIKYHPYMCTILSIPCRNQIALYYLTEYDIYDMF